MRARKAFLMLGLSVAVAGLVGEGLVGRLAAAAVPPPQSAATASKEAPSDELQRSTKIYYFKRIGESGAKRGMEIYLFKCWICHNEYTIKAGTPAPILKDLYKRGKLLSGQPVNDETVKAKIRNGGPLMPSYRYALNDKDVEDLVSYFREGMCCWDEENVPANQWFRTPE